MGGAGLRGRGGDQLPPLIAD